MPQAPSALLSTHLKLLPVCLSQRATLHAFRGCLRLRACFFPALSILCMQWGSSSLLPTFMSLQWYRVFSLDSSASFLVFVRLLFAPSAFFQSFCIHLSKLLYALWVSFLPNFFHLSEASLCYPLRLQALCYFLTFSETTLSSWSSFWLSLVSQALQSCFVLWDSLNLSTSSLASPKLLWLPCRLFSLFLPLAEVTLEHFQAFCCISTPPLFWS